MSENYKHIILSLAKFKFKFLLFKLIKGILLLLSVLLLYLLILFFSESLLYLKPEIKFFVFYISFVFTAFVFIWFLFLPFIKLVFYKKHINEREVAETIRKYIPEIEDSLINSIELAEDNVNDYSNELVWASIDQKIESLKIFDFNDALKLSSLKSYFLRFVFLAFLFFISLFLFKNIFVDSINRLIHYQSEFIRPAPFNFILKNENLQVRKGSGLKIELEIEGNEVPDFIYISFGGNNFLMERKENTFFYDIENINNSFLFYFSANNFYSKQYRIEVLPVPIIGNFEIEVIAPSYTNMKSEVYSNVGNLQVPYGALIKWNFKTFETSELEVVFNDTILYKATKKSNNFIFEKKALKNSKYSVSLKNEYFSENNILNYQIEVVPDLYPKIELVEIRDSINLFRYYFKGSISDDYGFSSLVFNIFYDGNDSIITIPFIKSLDQQDFYFTYDFVDLKEDNRVINYYFSVFDNDAVSGFKETSSESFMIKFPDKKERQSFENSSFKDLEKLMDESFKLNEEIRKDLNDLKMSQINSDLTEWEKQQKVNDIVEKRMSLEKILEEVSKKNEELNKYNNAFSEKKEDVLEKQQQIEDLLKEVLSDELKKLFEEFNLLAKDFNSKKLDELTDDMDMQLDDLSKQLERNLEMLKRMKVVQKVQSIIDELNAFVEKEKLHSKEFESSKNYDRTKEFEEKLEKEFIFQKEEYATIIDFNKELKKPLNLADFNIEFSEIGEEWKQLILGLEKKRKKSSTEKMESISEKIENLAYSMQQMLNSNEKKSASEDLDNLKIILDNLVYLSLSQEALHSSLKVLQNTDPLIGSIKTNQLKLIDQTIIVKDSLYSLAQRNPQISSIVNKEILNIQSNSKQAMEMLDEGRFYNVLINQQNSMTSYNNLALFISEAIKKAEEDMANGMPGDQECDKPGGKGKKQSMDLLKQSQDAIKKQMQKMIDQMKSGNMQGMNKQLGQTLAQQEIMQQLIREMMGDSEVGSSAKEQLKMVDQLLENNKMDIINRNISAQTINRHNLILNKLLNAEKSEIERDVDKERESKTAKEEFYSNPDLFFQYKNNVQHEEEQLIRSNYKLEHYYDKKYKKYLNSIEK